jgi:TolB-like protein
MRCLEKDPARRPQSAGELLAALEAARTPSGPHAVAPPPAPRRRVRAAAGLLAALVLVAAVALLRARRPSAPAPPLLVVLPFENLGPAADAYFADGLTEEVRGRLASVAGLRVIGGASARQYRGTTKPAHQIARELGATHLLTATVRWERAPGGGGRVRISPELVRAADQATVWAEPYEGPLTDVFEVQARAAERVAGALDLAFDVRRPDALAAAPTPNPSAYDQYLRGLALEQRSYFGAASWAAVVEAYGRAVALDPRFGLAWARLAGARAQGWTTEGQSDGAVLGLARAALDSARRLAPGAPDTHVAAARLAFAADRDYAEAVAQMRAAVRARPGDASLLAELGWRLVEAQDTAGPGLEEGLGYLARAAELEPQQPPRLQATYFLIAGRYRAAVRYADRVIALAPDDMSGYDTKAWALMEDGGGVAAARAVLDRAAAHVRPAVVTRDLVVNWWNDAAAVLGEPYAGRLEAMTLADFPAPVSRIDSASFYLVRGLHALHTGHRATGVAYCDSVTALLAEWDRDADRPPQRAGDPATAPLAFLTAAHACGNRPTRARRSGEALRAVLARPHAAWERSVVPFALATADALLGNRDSAVVHLARAVRMPSSVWVSWLRVDPVFASLRGDPRFEALLVRRRP